MQSLQQRMEMWRAAFVPAQVHVAQFRPLSAPAAHPGPSSAPLCRMALQMHTLAMRQRAAPRFEAVGRRHFSVWCSGNGNGAGNGNGKSGSSKSSPAATREAVTSRLEAAVKASLPSPKTESGEQVPEESIVPSSGDMLSKKSLVYLILCGIFFTNAIMGELTGGKFFELGPLTLSIGTLQWPVVFITTDLLNEYYGSSGVRAATYVAVGLLAYVFAIIFAAMHVPAAAVSPISDEMFTSVFGQSLWIIFGSVTAFFTSQIVDMLIFQFLKAATGEKFLWLRATGSTIFSQMIDSFIVGFLAFYLPGKFTFPEFLSTAVQGYSTKLVIAVLLTPLIYGAHAVIDGYLGEDLAEDMILNSVDRPARLEAPKDELRLED